MSQSNFTGSIYHKGIKQKIEQLKFDINKLREELSNTKDNKRWFEIQSEINSKQADIMIQKSRLDNYGKEAYIPDVIISN